MSGFQLFRFEVIGELSIQCLCCGLTSRFPTIPIWSNRWTVLKTKHLRLFATCFQLFRFEVIGERLCSKKAPCDQVLPEQFPTIPIWSNRWTIVLVTVVLVLFLSFQLFRFEVIGELFVTISGSAVNSCRPEFPTIPIWSNRWTKRRFRSCWSDWSWCTCFQLFRFEVIGEQAGENYTANVGFLVEFPTIPIWSNRWTFSKRTQAWWLRC